MIVYKDLPAEFGIRAIKDERFKVAIADRQNDIFDCFPLIQAGASPNEKEDEELTKETIKQMATWYGIVSFSKEPDNQLLWAHYGNSHQGMALGLEFPQGEQPFKVDYRADNRRVIIRKDEIDSIADGNPYAKHRALFENGLNAKGADWAYEKEYRHFERLDYCDKADGLYFKGSRRSLIRHVVLGARCTVDVEDVWRALSGGNRHENFQIFVAEPDQKEYKMRIIPYEVRPNRSWFWQP